MTFFSHAPCEGRRPASRRRRRRPPRSPCVRASSCCGRPRGRAGRPCRVEHLVQRSFERRRSGWARREPSTSTFAASISPSSGWTSLTEAPLERPLRPVRARRAAPSGTPAPCPPPRARTGWSRRPASGRCSRRRAEEGRLGRQHEVAREASDAPIPTAGPFTAATHRLLEPPHAGDDRVVDLVSSLRTSGMPSSGPRSKPALRSAPDEKPRPAPVMSTARTEGRRPALITSCSSAPKSAVQAFSESGRFRVRRPGPRAAPRCSGVSWLIGGACAGEPILQRMLIDAVVARALRLPHHGAGRLRLHRPVPCARRTAHGRHDPHHPRPLRPLLAPGRGAARRTTNLAGRPAGGGRARDGAA